MNFSKLVIFMLVIITFISLIKTNDDDKTTYFNNIDMKPFAIPIQTDLLPSEENLVFNKNYNNYTAKIYPLYRYKIYAKIYSKRYYQDASPAPCDLALGWDGLEKQEVFNSIMVSQYGRWVHWKLKKECPYSVDEVYLRLANNHIIPANDNILSGLRKLKKKDDVYIEGYLVRYESENGKNKYHGESSTTRADTGDHSCEVLYATKLISKYGQYN